MSLIGTIVGASATNYETLLTCRLLQGFGACAYESLLVAIVGDLYFVHERGLRIAFFNFCFASLNAIGSLIAGPITNSYGWRYMFYIYIPFIALQTLLIIFCTTETTYQRDTSFETDMAQVDFQDWQEKETREGKLTKETLEDEAQTAATNIPAKKTYWQFIALYHGRQSHDSPIKLFFRPFAICLNPAVIWVRIFSTLTSCLVLIVLSADHPGRIATDCFGCLQQFHHRSDVCSTSVQSERCADRIHVGEYT